MHDVVLEGSYGLDRRSLPHGQVAALRTRRHPFPIVSLHLETAHDTANARGWAPVDRTPNRIPSALFPHQRVFGRLDLSGKRVAEVGTGSGILALAAARAGAATVTGIDVNPNAAFNAAEVLWYPACEVELIAGG